MGTFRMFTAVLFLVFLVGSTFAESLYSKNTCAKELSNIIYYPSTCNSLYLTKLSVKFTTLAPRIFEPATRASTVFNFENTFRIKVVLLDPFGIRYDFVKESQSVYAINLSNDPNPYFYPSPARSFMNLGAYAFSPDTDQSVFRFQIFNEYGEYFNVMFVDNARSFVC